MFRPDHCIMFAVYLMELDIVTNEVRPVTQFGLAILFPRPRYDLQRLAVEDIHV